MASSDDEGELIPSNVSDYEFFSGGDEPVSFATLPVEWNEGEIHDTKERKLFLSGKTDNGLRKIYKPVIAWKIDLSFDRPEISVLSQEAYWVKLLKPRKPFEVIIRTILIAVHFLHFVKWNPQRSQQALWDHLNRSLSMFERSPSEDDLADHLPLIHEAVKRDETLANSKLLTTFLEEPAKRIALKEVEKLPFIVDDVNENDNQEDGLENIDEDGDGEPDEDDCFDSVCAICDNGGNLYLCDGKCMRSFHATVEDGEDSQCKSLGYTEEQLEMIKDISFICKNCEYKRHQCFACGKLGSSDESSGPEVFCCANGACGFFYHPECVAKLLHPGDGATAEEQRQKIAAGEKFACPAHRCYVCEELEVRSTHDLQFAVCRRCPRAYHRKCLPREIALEEDGDLEQRAWEDLLPKRILIYCLDHEIDPDISTPVRNHIKFPGPQREEKNKTPLENIKKNQLKDKGSALDDTTGKMVSTKPLKRVNKVSSCPKQSGLSRRRVEESSAAKMQRPSNRNYPGKLKERTTDEKESLGNKLYTAFYAMDSGLVKSNEGVSVPCDEKTQRVKPTARRITTCNLDADTKKRIFELMKDASSSLTLDQVKEGYNSLPTHTQFSKFSADNITLGRVEGSVQSLRAALKKLEGGGSTQDAKMVCGNDLLNQMLRWKDRMKVYLAPFLYGTRYTSFGRHFTKMDKLKEVVDILHWYFEDGDMLVDFCCGSNDFSCLMKKKLDEMGKKGSFKNYDLVQAKNDFNFEKRNWYDVTPNELADGSQLIIGLNPPFGVHASLANKFINKALEFKPKLLILIVPRETERLDKKESGYDLIWEDGQMFAGKSFYLPGSVDVYDKQIEDWNVDPPVLYLWSHPSCTSKHKAIAEKHMHPSGGEKCKLEENHNAIHAAVPSQEDHNLANNKTLEFKGEEGPVKPERQEHERVIARNQEDLPHEWNNNNNNNNSNTNKKKKKKKKKKKNNAGSEKNHYEENTNRLGGNRKRKKRSNTGMYPEYMSATKRPTAHHLTPSIAETRSPQRPEYSTQVHPGRHQSLDQMIFPPYQHQPTYVQAVTVYNDNETVDDVARRYNSSGGKPQQTYDPISPGYGFTSLANHNNNSFPYNNRPSSYMGETNKVPNSWSQRNAYSPSSYPRPGFQPSSFGQVNPAANPNPYGELTNTITSAMQMYAPPPALNNHGQMSNIVHRAPPPPPMHDGSGIYHGRNSRPLSHTSSPLEFAQGPYRPYSQHNSSGWLNE